MISQKTAAEHGGRQLAARGGRRVAEGRSHATEAARQAVYRLRAARGPLMFVQSAGCCDGSAPMCLPAGEYLAGPGDVLLGRIAGCTFYMDARQYRAWHPDLLVLDVEPGVPEGFSLAAARDCTSSPGLTKAGTGHSALLSLAAR